MVRKYVQAGMTWQYFLFLFFQDGNIIWFEISELLFIQKIVDSKFFF